MHTGGLKQSLVVALVAATWLWSDQPGAAPGAVPSPEMAARATELLAPFKKDLKAALSSGMAEGPAAAIDACRVEAPAIAARLSVDDVRMGRSSHRLRNPANDGPGWVTAVIEDYLADPASVAPRVVDLPLGRAGYVEPIRLQPLCVACHGATLAPDVEQAVARRYPEDAATGFEVGDLRGVFWVEMAGE